MWAESWELRDATKNLRDSRLVLCSNRRLAGPGDAQHWLCPRLDQKINCTVIMVDWVTGWLVWHNVIHTYCHHWLTSHSMRWGEVRCDTIFSSPPQFWLESVTISCWHSATVFCCLPAFYLNLITKHQQTRITSGLGGTNHWGLLTTPRL